MKRYWNHLDTRTIFTNRIVSLRQDTYHFLPNDIIKDFTVFEFGDWVNIIPMTSRGEVVLIRQYRHGVMRETIEIPGGLVSEGDADPAEAALREMEEETGYFSTDVIHIGTVEPNPAIQTNRCFTFLARNVHQRSPQMLDATEAIHVDLVGKDTVYSMIRSGEITHGLVVAAFAYLLLHEQYSDATDPCDSR
ncbi:MAG: NUDIX hydrolase [Desulfomonilia bacterium]